MQSTKTLHAISLILCILLTGIFGQNILRAEIDSGFGNGSDGDLAEMERALLNGEIVERYPDDLPYPSCLVLGWLISGDPLHIVCSRGDVEPALRIVTLYEPEDALWKDDYKTRRGKK